MLTLFWDVRSLLGIREEALFVMNLYYVGKSAHETLLTSRSQLKATFLVEGCKKKERSVLFRLIFSMSTELSQMIQKIEAIKYSKGNSF